MREATALELMRENIVGCARWFWDWWPHLDHQIVGEWSNLLQAHEHDVIYAPGPPGSRQQVVHSAGAQDDAPDIGRWHREGRARARVAGHVPCVV